MIRIAAFATLLGVCSASAADKPRDAAIALKVALDGDKATVTVAFNYTGKTGDPPTFQGVRMYQYELTRTPARPASAGKGKRASRRW